MPDTCIAIASPLADSFDTLLAEYHRLNAISDAFARDALDPVHAELDRRMDALPHFRSSFENISGGETAIGTDVRDTIGMVRSIVRSRVGRDRKGGPDDHFVRACRHVVAGEKWRERHLHRIRRELGCIWLEDHAEELDRQACAACWAAVEYPVRSIRELQAKIDFVAADQKWDIDTARDAIVADVRRLAGDA